MKEKRRRKMMETLTEQQIEALRPYLQHKLVCNIMQDWSEAEIALADTPDKFRDEGWHIAYEEMKKKMTTCTCGLDDLLALQKAEGKECKTCEGSGNVPYGIRQDCDLQICPDCKGTGKQSLSPKDGAEVTDEYKKIRNFVGEWLWNPVQFGDERKSESFTLEQCRDTACMIQSYLKFRQTK